MDALFPLYWGSSVDGAVEYRAARVQSLLPSLPCLREVRSEVRELPALEARRRDVRAAERLTITIDGMKRLASRHVVA